MSNKGEKTHNSEPTMNPSSPYYLHPTYTRLKIVANVFTSIGFKGWKCSDSIGFTSETKYTLIFSWVLKVNEEEEEEK